MTPFVHLHSHTEYSLLECPIRINDLVNKAKETGMDAVAITDNGTMYGVIQFYLAAKSKGLNPIVGCDMYVTSDISVKERGLNRLVLLCKDFKGYQNLIQLVTISHLQGFYYKPRIDLHHLAQYTDGLIAISSGMRGPVGYPLRQNDTEEALKAARALKDMYGENFYLGMHRAGFPMEDLVNDALIELGKSENIPLVALNDVSYLTKEASYIKDVLSCIQTGKLVHEETRGRNQTEELYFKTADEMAALFQDCPEALENTVKIANQCQLKLETEQVKLPRFECPDNLSSEDYLEKLVWEGIAKKYGDITPEIKERVEFELNVIKPMQYAPYFLIIYDFLKFCSDEGIPTGPGRGSAAGSIVAYALDITKIDPIRYKLLFERFLNPERVSMPDIDLDFCIRRRNEVIDYIVKQYGDDRVSQIATFGTMASRGVIRDVGRVLNVPLRDVDRIAKLIPSAPGQYTSIPEALEQVPELKRIYESAEEFKQLIDVGIQLEGVSRHTSTHAAGVVISRDPLSSVVPLIKNEGQVVTQFSMTDLEKVGLLKMDILGLRNLTVMKDAVDLIRQRHGVTLDLDNLPTDDVKTYDLLCSGNTTGVFQLEGRGMRALIKDMQPRVFEDIIAALALYRPGPLGSGMVSDFVSNKLGKTQPKYDLPELEPILKETYGLIVYQEQVMQIASVIGGFTLGQADMLRRAMGKKKKEEMDKLREEFVNGAITRSFPETKARHIFELCYKFAEYGFNKSHSAAYALISYQTAYLKANFPLEYMTALLSSVLGVTDRVSIYVNECKAMGIQILPPDVNYSGVTFTIQDNPQAIRFGLGAIKNVGEGAIETVIKNRDGGYASFGDLCLNVDLKQVNKRVFESLIKSGACDSFAERSLLLGNYEKILDQAQSLIREKEQGQVSLFGASDPSQDLILNPDNALYLSPVDKLKYEKELLGLYISGHPLEAFKDTLGKQPTIDGLRSEDEGKMVMLMGLLSNCRRTITKQKKEMLMGTLEDMTGTVSLIVFPSDKIEEQAKHFQDDAIVRIRGRLRTSQDEMSVSCVDIDPVQHNAAKQLFIDTENMDDITLYESLKSIFVSNRGPLQVNFMVGEQRVLAHEKFWVSDNPKAIQDIETLIGNGHFWVV
jgi:DNA polymerase-3 subunit alpha